MKKVLISLLFSILLLPLNSSFSQELTETPGTLGIVLSSITPYYYKDDSGYTIVIGQVENTKDFPVTDVKIWVGFYDNVSEQPLESTIGQTLLDVIPPYSKSPYIIRSTTPNSAITNVSVNLLGFTSAPPKQIDLEIFTDEPDVSNSINFSGTITNNNPVESLDTKIHVVFHDAFIPYRLIANSTFVIDKPIAPGETVLFSFDEPRYKNAVGFLIFAESNIANSKVTNIPLPQPEVLTRLITISDVSTIDSQNNKISDVTTGTQIFIKSGIWLQFATDQENYEQPYVYYTQIKKTVLEDNMKKTYVEFVGKSEGKFETGGKQFPMVGWVPENEGLYFIETFVWSPEAVPLASKGPVSLILVT